MPTNRGTEPAETAETAAARAGADIERIDRPRSGR